jgi:replicative DNA helicase
MPKKKIFTREEFLLGFIFSYPEMYEDIAKNLIDNIKLDPETEKFYNALKKVYTRESSVTIESLKEELSEEDQEKIGIYALLIEESYVDFSEDSAKREVEKLIKEINRKNIYNVQKECEFSIRISQDPGEKKILLNRYNELLKLAAKI